jgi:transcriptional regulator with XRE-family HTH domain
VGLSRESARIRFGIEVRRFRERAGLSQQQVARAVPMAQSHLSQLERGRKGTSNSQIPRIDSVLSANGALVQRWHDLHKRDDGYADWFRNTREMEQTASLIRIYNPLVVPGLLQTEPYARTVIRYGDPAATQTELDDLVKGRMDRQAILSDERGPRVEVVLCESVLRRTIGGHTTMNEQITRLLDAGEHPRITVQVLPLSSPDQPGLDGAFAIFRVPEHGELVFTETRIDGHPVDDPAGVEEYAQVFSELRAAALPRAATPQFIQHLRRELHDPQELD